MKTFSKAYKAAALALGLLGCTAEGVYMDRPADGVIDSQEKVAIVHEVYSQNLIKQDNEALLSLWNDFRVSRKQWLAQKNFNPGQEGLHLKLYATKEDAKERNETLGGDGDANFFRENTRTIYGFHESFTPSYSVTLHEAGHDLGVREQISEASRIWGSVFTLCMDPAVGTSVVIPNAKGFQAPIFHEQLPHPEEDYSLLDEYQRAILLFVNKAIDNDGDLDDTLIEIKQTDEDTLDNYLDSIYSNTENAQAIWYESFLKLIQLEGFEDYLQSLIQRRGGTEVETSQLQKYLEIGINELFAVQGDLVADSRRLEKMEELFNMMKIQGVHYPDMQNRISKVLGNHYSEISQSAMGMEKVEYLEKVIDLFSHLPCEFDEWACTDYFTEIQNNHLDAYKNKLDTLRFLGDNLGVVTTVNQFLEKFYFDENYEREETKDLLFHMLRMGVMNAKLQANNSVGVEQDQWRCVALDFAELYDSVACYNQEDAQTCMEEHLYSWEQEQITRAEELVDLRILCPR